MCCPDAPVGNVGAANHRGYIDDRVACHTHFVEAWILANQMTDQETTMGASRKCHLLCVESATFQNAFYSKLEGKRELWCICGQRIKKISTGGVQGTK